METFTIKPIGYIHSEHQQTHKTPIQPVFCWDCTGQVSVLPEYEEGLTDIEGFSHIILLYWLHKATPALLSVKPFLEDKEHGLFATRFPGRPNPIGISIVQLIGREGCTLHIRGVDILDNTPLVDIKPYNSGFDCFPDARDGWYKGVNPRDAQDRGRRGFKK